MPWRFVKGRQAQAGKVAILRGPVVFGLSPSRDKALKGISLATLNIDTSSIEGPLADPAVRPDGMASKIRAWRPTKGGLGMLYDLKKPGQVQLYLTELPDPNIEAIYFRVPNPIAKELSDDELFAQR